MFDQHDVINVQEAATSVWTKNTGVAWEFIGVPAGVSRLQCGLRFTLQNKK